MPITDRVELIRLALAAIWDGDATLRTMCGRTTNIAVEPFINAEQLVPVLVFDVTYDHASQVAGVEVAAVAEDAASVPATQTCHLLLERAVSTVTCSALGAAFTALSAPTVEAVPLAPAQGSTTSLDATLVELVNVRNSLRFAVRGLALQTF